MPGKMKIMYLNLYKLTLSQLLFNGFDSKFKINLYNEHFPDTLEKYTRFSKFTLFFSISYVRINICGSLCCCFLWSLSFQQHPFFYNQHFHKQRQAEIGKKSSK